jgi:ABC-type nitrate/sulfonate/bicarbonate transport system ATPase subunit
VRIGALQIRNFKALTRLELPELGDAVVLAGPNGCGKSCVLDAIRLLKSAYGGYQQNEWHQWFGEFAINFQVPEQVLRVFQDPARPLEIVADFSFAEREKEYLRQNAAELLRGAAWRELVPELASWRSFLTTSFAVQYRAHNEEVERRAQAGREEFLADLEGDVFRAAVVVDTNGTVRTEPARVLEIAFEQYEPESIGILDFHSPNRQYNRENVAGINLDLTSARDQRRMRSMYDVLNKYAGLKTEMASVFVRRILAAEGGGATEGGMDLIEALRDLFETFFPGKKFEGPVATPDGRVDFPVVLPDGSTHDLDDLSSGEKEVLYGYMRLRSSASRNSVILLDEPELHLNPRLIRGLARFYYNHLVTSHGNQLWLITHSDTLLREAVNLQGFQVYHMRRGDRTRPDDNQAAPVTMGEELERIVIELVGDLAAYRPGAKVVLFEGGGDVEFDVRMVARLFPDFDAAVNTVAAGNRRQVSALHEVLERLGGGALGARFYAIRDRDSARHVEQVGRQYTWAAYHIENYLLDPEFILRALQELTQADVELIDVDRVDAALLACAEETIPKLVRDGLVAFANERLVTSLRVGADPNAQQLADTVAASVQSSAARVAEVTAEELSLARLQEEEAQARASLEAELLNGEWRTSYRGRDVLRLFVGRHVRGMNYEGFRDLIVARMREAGHQPLGMAVVLDAILADPFP